MIAKRCGENAKKTKTRVTHSRCLLNIGNSASPKGCLAVILERRRITVRRGGFWLAMPPSTPEGLLCGGWSTRNRRFSKTSCCCEGGTVATIPCTSILGQSGYSSNSILGSVACGTCGHPSFCVSRNRRTWKILFTVPAPLGLMHSLTDWSYRTFTIPVSNS